MNEHDTRKMLLILHSIGYGEVHSYEEADLILFNTCTIREKAHHKAISEIGRAAEMKRRRADLIVGVCGCVAQQEGARLRDRYPEIDLIFGPDQIASLPELVASAEGGASALALDLVNTPQEYRFVSEIPHGKAPLQSFVMVMKGCNCACSYCIVPSVRGREISRPADDIVEEVRELANSGAKEITLLGQNVSAYRADGGGRGSGLAGLIRRIAGETGIERIRFTSPHPLFISDELIEEFASNPKLCPHIHLPAQSGSSRILREMRRGYSRELYIEKAESLRKARPGISITTDLIVGFPGESVEEFEDTLAMMREVAFDSAFAFKYSPRPGTEAAREMKDDVPMPEKERRLEELLRLQGELSFEKNDALRGDVADVLAVGTDRMQRGLLTGRRADNRIVHFSGNPEIVGDIVPVRITGAHQNSLRGELTDVERRLTS